MKWQYKTIFIHRNDALGDDNLLNEVGENGWEAYAVQESGLCIYVYFKKPL